MRQLKITKQITNRDSRSIVSYFEEVNKYDLISPDEEVELAQRIRDGDKKALEKMVKANLRFVISVAKQYQNQGLSLPDLINEGNLGLIKAAKRFDETRGFKFISYAVWWIRQSILQSLGENARMVRLPLNQIGNINKINQEYARLEQQYEREPSFDEIAQNLELTGDKVEDTMKNSKNPKSIDAPLVEGEEVSLINMLTDDESPDVDSRLINESLKVEVERSLNSLSEKERNVLIHFYGIGMQYPMTLDEIGNKFSLTRERVRQIKEKGLRNLRHTSRRRLLKKYLG